MPLDTTEVEVLALPVDDNDPEIEKMRAEIRAAIGKPNVRNRLAKDFKWQISKVKIKGSRKQSYRLRSAEGQSAREGWYYLGNIVFQGGGTLGLAHAGLLAALEDARIRFAGIAGTSAGSIIAMGIVAARGEDLTKDTAGEIDKLVRNMPMDTFIDGPRRVRLAIKHLLLGRSPFAPSQWLNMWFCFRRVLRLYGLNPGIAFEDWMQETLERFGLDDMDSLTKRLRAHSVALCEAKSDAENPFTEGLPEKPDGSEMLRIISTAMPVGSKFSFPEHIRYLDTEGQSVSPAALVRMSMSIPVFFEPRSMPVKKAVPIEKSEWAKFVAKYIAPFSSKQEVSEALETERLYFLDGGLFSNLPVSELPERKGIPTVTVPLISNRFLARKEKPNRFTEFFGHIATLVHAVRRLHDREGVQRTRPKMLKVDTGDANWLNFLMTEEEKTELYRAGYKRGRDMLVEDKWDELED